MSDNLAILGLVAFAGACAGIFMGAMMGIAVAIINWVERRVY